MAHPRSASKAEPTHVALDRLPAPVVLIDGEGVAVYCNEASKRILARGDGIFVLCDYRLGFSDAAAQRQYGRLISGMATAGVFKVARASGTSPYLVRIVPLETRAGAVVFIIDPCAEFTLDRELLAAAYALTAAEIRLAEALIRGDTLTEFSLASGVRPSTARTQLLSVFKKTGISRQALLVKLLMSLRARE